MADFGNDLLPADFTGTIGTGEPPLAFTAPSVWIGEISAGGLVPPTNAAPSTAKNYTF